MDNQKLWDFLSLRNVVVVYTPSSLHKSVRQIKKANNILQNAFKRMHLPNEEWDDAVTRPISSVNERLVEDISFTPSEVLLGFHLYSLVQEMNRVLRKD